MTSNVGVYLNPVYLFPVYILGAGDERLTRTMLPHPRRTMRDRAARSRKHRERVSQ